MDRVAADEGVDGLADALDEGEVGGLDEADEPHAVITMRTKAAAAAVAVRLMLSRVLTVGVLRSGAVADGFRVPANPDRQETRRST